MVILGLESSGIKLTAEIAEAKKLPNLKISSDMKRQGEEPVLSKFKLAPKTSSEKSSIKCSHQATEKKNEKHTKNSGHTAFFAAFNACQII